MRPVKTEKQTSSQQPESCDKSERDRFRHRSHCNGPADAIDAIEPRQEMTLKFGRWAIDRRGE
jgi:hypothetical protein